MVLCEKREKKLEENIYFGKLSFSKCQQQEYFNI